MTTQDKETSTNTASDTKKPLDENTQNNENSEKNSTNTSTSTRDNSRKKNTNNQRTFKRPTRKFNNKSNLSFELLVQRRVSTTREGGQKTSFSVLSVCGDKEGSLGIGEGKASDVAKAATKANNAAKKNLVSVFRGEKRNTVFHNSVIKKGGLTLVITKASSGKGLKTIAAIEKMCRVTGITDLSVKTHGSRNSLNIAKLFFQALTEQIPTKQINAFRSVSKKI